MIVDAHAHVWTLDPARYPWRPLLRHVPPPKEAAPPDELIGWMDEMSVAYGVLVQPSTYGYDHAYLLATLDRHPARFVGIWLADPTGGAAAPEHLALRGARWNLVGTDLSRAELDAAAERIAGALCDRRSMLCLQAGPEHLAWLAAFAARWPELPIVVDHLGLFDVTAAPGGAAFRSLLALADPPSVATKLAGLEFISRAAHPHRDCAPHVAAAYRAFGAERLLWGSNFPYGSRADAGVLLDALLPELGDGERAAILGANAARIWGRPVSAAPARG